jgi:2-keto-4-pentenoate hydratase/2-oxohepta-3-ene-1,7-dioic acid hydratase in catechol pathway
MKLATFSHGGSMRIGVVDGDDVVDLSAADTSLPTEMSAFLAAGDAALAAAKKAVEAGGNRIAVADVTLEAPVQRPGKYLGVGLNYLDHIQQTGQQVPENLIIFNKQSTCVNGPYAPFHMPKISDNLDYEGELGLVIGKRCRHVSKADAAKVIAGYTVVNDVSVRDVQRKARTLTLGKSYDTHGPMGPWIVTSDEVGDPHTLASKTWINDELRQDTNTEHLIFDCYDIVSQLSTIHTLEPGDVIATGTSGGTANGFDPPKWIKVGDVVKIEIEKVGTIANEVIAEPESTAHIG